MGWSSWSRDKSSKMTVGGTGRKSKWMLDTGSHNKHGLSPQGLWAPSWMTPQGCTSHYHKSLQDNDCPGFAQYKQHPQPSIRILRKRVNKIQNQYNIEC